MTNICAIHQVFIPRSYQVELLEKALKKNIIVCLGTGSGKTFIAVMLIREMMGSVKKSFSEGGKRTIFLARTVPLVTQQAAVIRNHTGFNVGEYTSASNVGRWNTDQWKLEFEKNLVLVMTTQLLLNILNNGFIHLSKINLLIFDECHHAVGDDPVVDVMKHYAKTNPTDQPKILGLTASIIHGKCKTDKILNKIKDLETTLNSVVETSTNLMAELYSTKPNEHLIRCKNELTVDITSEFRSQFYMEKNKKFNVDMDFEDSEKLNLKLNKLLVDLQSSINELGVWCAKRIAKQMIIEMNKIETDITVYDPTYFSTVKSHVQNFVQLVDNYCSIHARGVDSMLKFTSYKFYKLLDILVYYKRKNMQSNTSMLNTLKEGNTNLKSNDFKAIIFVERRYTAWAINEFFHNLKEHTQEYDFINSEYVVGHGIAQNKLNFAQMKSNEQTEKIIKFRSSECNVLVATTVMEEGMDIPACNLVIRFDMPKDFTSYVQSKGRARAVDSNYIMLANEIDYNMLKEAIDLYRGIENALQQICKERMPPTESEMDDFSEDEIPPYRPKGIGGPEVNMNNAIQLLYRYCAMLPKDKFTQLVPRLKFEKVSSNYRLRVGDIDAEDETLLDEFEVLPSNSQGNSQFRCIIWLPVNSPLRTAIVGDVMRSLKLAKKSAAIKACQKLHECGELTDDLVPSCEDCSFFTRSLLTVEEEKVCAGSPQPGSAKRHQFYPKQIASQLQKCPSPNTPYYFYIIHIKSQSIDAEVPNFGIITSSALPKVTNFPIFTKKGKKWIEVIEIKRGVVIETAELESIAQFHLKFFTEYFEFNAFPMEFKPLEAEMGLFIIPVINFGTTNAPNYNPNWELIDKVNNYKCAELPSKEVRMNFQYEETKFIDSLVVPLYFPRKVFYMVKTVKTRIFPSHPFPDKSYETFQRYFKEKYNIEIQNMNQQLLSVKKLSRCALNLLSNKTEEILKRKTMANCNKVEQFETFLVPELCDILPMSASQFQQGMTIPTVIYRLNELLLAQNFLEDVLLDTKFLNLSELVHGKWSKVDKKCRDMAVANEINCNRDYKSGLGLIFSVAKYDLAPHVILNALTARAANDCFDFERLEFLGDSFLKYTSTLYLFSELPTANEGKLTSGRSELVSNSHLYHLAKEIGLVNLIKTEMFSPNTQWMPPGFVLNAQSENKLLNARIPFHAWKHFVGYDLSEMTGDDIWKVIDMMHLEKPEQVKNLAKYQLVSDKTVADCVEAVLGAFLLYSGPKEALRFLNYIGFKILPINESTGLSEEIGYKFPTSALIDSSKSSEIDKLFERLGDFEKEIGYVFKDKSFLIQAFTHPSYYNNQITDCYQRLEFLGDALLDYLVAWHLFKDERKFNPGQLTDIRSALVNNNVLGKLAVTYHFHNHLKAKCPALFTAINKFLQMDERNQRHNSENHMTEMDVEPPKVLGDIFESVAGAIYLDNGCSLDGVWDIYFKFFESYIDEYTVHTPKMPVREVYEVFPDIEFGEATLDTDTLQQYCVTAKLGVKTYKGFGDSKKQAKINVAKDILRREKKNLKSGGLEQRGS